MLITHELGPAAPLVTRTLVLRDGAVCDEPAGSPRRPAARLTTTTARSHHATGDRRPPAPATGRPGSGPDVG